MLERSAQAPQNWRQENTEAHVRATVLEQSPDLVLLQELPRMVPFIETHGMIKANPQSHSGNLAMLVKHELLDPEPAFTTVKGVAILATFGDLTVANVHLAPGPAGTAERLEQLAKVVEASPTKRLLVVGDTNTRLDEEEALADAGLTGVKPSPATWNSKRNKFRHGGAEFTAYFTRWFASPGVTVTDVEVWNDPIEASGHSFYPSDHFALAGTVTTDD